MAVNPVKSPAVKYDLAMKYIEYIIPPGTQDIIRNYGKYGEALFVPAANALED